MKSLSPSPLLSGHQKVQNPIPRCYVSGQFLCCLAVVSRPKSCNSRHQTDSGLKFDTADAYFCHEWYRPTTLVCLLVASLYRNSIGRLWASMQHAVVGSVRLPRLWGWGSFRAGQGRWCEWQSQQFDFDLWWFYCLFCYLHMGHMFTGSPCSHEIGVQKLVDSAVLEAPMLGYYATPLPYSCSSVSLDILSNHARKQMEGRLHPDNTLWTVSMDFWILSIDLFACQSPSAFLDPLCSITISLVTTLGEVA